MFVTHFFEPLAWAETDRDIIEDSGGRPCPFYTLPSILSLHIVGWIQHELNMVRPTDASSPMGPVLAAGWIMLSFGWKWNH
jgi:hypothetical protein